jgi:hypothetical protein
MNDSPLTKLLKGLLSKCDFGVLQHGFVAAGEIGRVILFSTATRMPSLAKISS